MPHAEPSSSSSSEFTPSAYPPFDSNTEKFPTISLETISLAKIQNNDETEQDRMLTACKTWGFFYLDLTNSDQGRVIAQDSENIARVAEEIFNLPMEEKEKYSYRGRKDIFGYKLLGQTIVDKSSTPDKAEFFNVSKNDILLPPSQRRYAWPAPVLSNEALFATYSKTAHSIGLQLLSVLFSKLGIDEEELRSRHVLEEWAGDLVRMTRGPPRESEELPEIQTPAHTDFGTITILMNWLGGLQVYGSPNKIVGNLDFDDSSSANSWLWVKPKPNCAIVNLGDAAVKFTNGVLCSGRHRVIPSPGAQGLWPRYSVVYFVRPNDTCRMKSLKGHGVPEAEDQDEEGIQASEWIHQQAMNLQGNVKK